jgi:zinc D-Ala-D-Ala dipeptidase
MTSSELLPRARAAGMVLLAEACPGLRVDLRYATAANFTGAPFYPPDLPALLHAQTAARLEAARAVLAAEGADLLVWDAWRPPEAQLLLWECVQDERYVARPAPGRRWSWHCYGRAVDVTIVCAATGAPWPVPGDLDDFTPGGSAVYAGSDPAVAAALGLLQRAMCGAGFRLLEPEWWHFSDPLEPPPAEPFWLDDKTALAWRNEAPAAAGN